MGGAPNGEDEMMAGQKRKYSRAAVQDVGNQADKGKAKKRDAKKGNVPQIQLKDPDTF